MKFRLRVTKVLIHKEKKSIYNSIHIRYLRKYKYDLQWKAS